MKHVIITGGSSGIGAALAALYAQRGDRVSLIARSERGLAAQREALVGGGVALGAVFCQSADVASADAITSAIKRCEAVLGPCDILITSAGIVEPGTFEIQEPDRFQAQMETNFFGSVHAVRAVYPGMKARGSGSILLVSSGMGLIGIYGYTAYSASKFALHGFAEALRAEALPHGVRVSICFPPDTLTPQLAREASLRPPEAEAVIGNVRPWNAEKVAGLIVKAFDRGRFEIYFGFQIFALGRFGSFIKPGLNIWFDRTILKIRRRPA